MSNACERVETDTSVLITGVLYPFSYFRMLGEILFSTKASCSGDFFVVLG